MNPPYMNCTDPVCSYPLCGCGPVPNEDTAKIEAIRNELLAHGNRDRELLLQIHDALGTAMRLLDVLQTQIKENVK